MRESIIDVSRDFFFEVVKPILERSFPDETARTTFGVFGYGSEVLRLDDEYSADHHWGLRINALMPEALFEERATEILRVVEAEMPDSYRGHNLREGLSGGKGLSLTSMEGYLCRTIGLTKVPETYQEWLSVPEEDITHVINGEIWLDETGQFSAIREAFLGYYPEPVRLRRIAHWCRYFSGMGSYALKRALLRYNEWYAAVAFARAIRLGVQLAFLLDRQYCPYDKWTMAFFAKLPRMYFPLAPIVNEAVSLASPWSRKLELLNEMADVLDQAMVEDGIVPPHPPYTHSPTSGYRLLEHDYAAILRSLPPEIRPIVPVWDQIYLEEFHSSYVASLDLETWDSLLNLTPEKRGWLMNSKERVLATCRRAPVDRTPLDCWLYQRQFVEKLEAEYGSREQFLDEFGIDIFLGWTPYSNQFGQKFDIKELAGLALEDPHDPKWVSYAAWNPDFAGLGVTQAVEQQGNRRAIIAHFWGIVEGTSTFLGIEKCWANLRRNPDLMRAWFDRFADWLCGLSDSCIDAGADIMQMSDDWGSNQTMLFRPEMWRDLIKPYAGRVIQHIRSRGVPVSLHSDGYIMPILDDLVEMGVNMLHPVQESAGMDPQTVKAGYGDKLVIYGSLDTVDALLLQEGAALADYIAGRFAIYAPGGGFIFNTGHMVQPDTAPQRLVGAYRLASELARTYGT